MDKVYQVFVSSTFSDLQQERKEVSNTLAKAGYIAAGMELFPATDQQQLEFIQRVIDRSDYYVVIVGGRYGSIAEDGKSFTEKEFEYARSKGIPVLAFLHEDPKSLAVSKTDEDATKAFLLESFKEELKLNRLVQFWRDTPDLCTKVVISVMNSTNLRPGIGWVRGDQAIDPKVLQESERLRMENAELRDQLAALSGDELAFDPSLLGPDDTMEIQIQISGTLANVNVPIKDLFLGSYDLMLAERPETFLGGDIGRIAAPFYKGTILEGHGLNVQLEWLQRIRDQFSALGLIKPTSVMQGTNNAKFVVWSVTDKGRRFAAKHRALRKSSP